ncbi:MAG: hypothetical protein H6634_17450 [Anaerolineales bacterium]|nr:hypothetical protein [Anaerolineales bacterium]
MTYSKNIPAIFSFLLPKPHKLDSPHVVLALGLAGISLGQALQHGDGFLNASSLFYLTLALIFLGWGLFAVPAFGQSFFSRIAFPILLLGLVLQIYQLTFTYVGDYQFLSLLPTLWQLRLLVLVAGGFALLSLAPQKWVPSASRNGLTLLALTVNGLAGVWVIQQAPTPFIDVFVYHQNSGWALAHGIDPYSLTTANIYGDLGKYGYGAELFQGDVLNISNPYPPLSIYISSLGYFMGGDIRYSHLFVFILSCALIAFLHPGRGTKLAAYVFLFTPKSLYVIEQSWTEPIVVFLLVVVVYAYLHRSRWLEILVGLFFASKQYLLFAFPLVLMIFQIQTPFFRWFRRMSIIALTALLVTAPLALWNINSFLWNVGEAQWYQPFRLDALSYLSAYARVSGTEPTSLIAFAALAFALYLSWRNLPRTIEGFAAAFAFSMAIFFAFNKQAFCNYYFLVIGTISCTWAVIQSKEPFEELKESPVSTY